MKTITTRKLDQETYDRAEKFLQQAGHHAKNNMFFYQLEVQGGTDDGLVLDALVDLYDNKIAIKAIWVLENNPQKGMFSARNDGERGGYAKILGEKYFNRFFEHLDTVDIDNVQERQGFLFDGGKFITVIGSKEDFNRLTPIMIDINNVKDGRYAITPDLIKKVEDEIDHRIDPKQITEAVINAYDRIELILSAEQALRYLCKGLGEEDYKVSYDRDAQVFEVAFHSSEFNISISLGDAVHKKWETGECFAKAALICGGDLYEIAEERKQREAHCIKHLLEQAMPGLRKIAGQDKAKLEALKDYYRNNIEIQVLLYDEGKLHSEEGCEMWSRVEFLAEHEGFASHKEVAHLIDLFYLTYCDGYANTNGDYLFSGIGGIRIPALSIGWSGR